MKAHREGIHCGLLSASRNSSEVDAALSWETRNAYNVPGVSLPVSSLRTHAREMGAGTSEAKQAGRNPYLAHTFPDTLND